MFKGTLKILLFIDISWKTKVLEKPRFWKNQGFGKTKVLEKLECSPISIFVSFLGNFSGFPSKNFSKSFFRFLSLLIK